MANPHVEVGIKPQLKPRGSVAKEEDPNLPTSCTSRRLNHTINKAACVSVGSTKGPESAHKRKRTSSDSCGHWRQEHTGAGPDWNLSCLHSRARDQHSIGGHPREVRWIVTPREGKDSESMSFPTVRKANKGINVGKIIVSLKN